LSSFLIFKPAIKHAIQLIDAMIVNSSDLLQEVHKGHKNIIATPVNMKSLRLDKKFSSANDLIFEGFRNFDNHFCESISLERKFESSKLHFYDGKNYIVSTKENISVYNDGALRKVSIPCGKLNKFAFNRPLERLFRADQYNILTYGSLLKFFVIRDHQVFLVDLTTNSTKVIEKSIGCRGIMHRAHCLLPDGRLIFGEYGHRPSKGYVPIYIIHPGNGRLEESDCLALIKAKHIHAIRWDKFSDQIWLCTGDKDGECHIIILSKDFEIIDRIGDGTQLYRTCDFIFTLEDVIWVMDSPLVESKVVTLSRSDKQISVRERVPGPAWYISSGLEGRHLLSISMEPGLSVSTMGAQILMSSDGKDWERILYLKKDLWPSIFKYGVCEIGSDREDLFYVNYQATVFNDGNSEVFRVNSV